MLLIAITSPDFFPEETMIIPKLLDWGISRIHLRKPTASYQDCARLLSALPSECYSRIVVHDHFGLAHTFPLHGIHLNRRNPVAPQGFTGSVSCSCHSLNEAEQAKSRCNYVFLSPVFDSVSKSGYRSAFTPDTLTAAACRGIIDSKVVALGGVSADRLPTLKSLGFGGAALLGDIWNRIHDANFEQYVRSLSAAASE
ncbi:thiamine phosphate synthase [Prevotella dentasini]|uniref:thiamine phosphate synthase n=1 Tax=Prevotella dentasini TaxID=589537 RepID=UPI0004695941|nr:thiamine phosphate synthase [Prevotella dentasini]